MNTLYKEHPLVTQNCTHGQWLTGCHYKLRENTQLERTN